MSASEVRLPLATVEPIAELFAGLLKEHCKRIVIAGSIRRRRPTIGDVDLVCEPLTTPRLDLFGAPSSEVVDQLDDWLTALRASGSVQARQDSRGRTAWGKSLKRLTFADLPFDVQAVHDPNTFGMWVVIRTGPNEFCKRLVTPRRQGGLLPAGFEVKDGFQVHRWGERIPTQTEASVFEALGLDWIPPEDR